MRKNAPGVDGRIRLHLWPSQDAVSWSVGPVGHRMRSTTYGDALNDALATISHDDLGPGVVVIVEPVGI